MIAALHSITVYSISFLKRFAQLLLKVELALHLLYIE